METSPKNRKRKLQISLTAMVVIALAAVAFFVLILRNAPDTGSITISKEVNNVKVVDIQKDSVSSQEEAVE